MRPHPLRLLGLKGSKPVETFTGEGWGHDGSSQPRAGHRPGAVGAELPDRHHLLVDQDVTGLTNDDQLSLTLGRVARRHVDAEWALRVALSDLRAAVPSPRPKPAKDPKTFSDLVTRCKQAAHAIQDAHPEVSAAALLVLGKVSVTNDLRNRVLHDYWAHQLTGPGPGDTELVRVRLRQGLAWDLEAGDGLKFAAAVLVYVNWTRDLLTGLSWALTNLWLGDQTTTGTPTSVLLSGIHERLAQEPVVPM